MFCPCGNTAYIGFSTSGFSPAVSGSEPNLLFVENIYEKRDNKSHINGIDAAIGYDAG